MLSFPESYHATAALRFDNDSLNNTTDKHPSGGRIARFGPTSFSHRSKSTNLG